MFYCQAGSSGLRIGRSCIDEDDKNSDSGESVRRRGTFSLEGSSNHPKTYLMMT